MFRLLQRSLPVVNRQPVPSVIFSRNSPLFERQVGIIFTQPFASFSNEWAEENDNAWASSGKETANDWDFENMNKNRSRLPRSDRSPSSLNLRRDGGRSDHRRDGGRSDRNSNYRTRQTRSDGFPRETKRYSQPNSYSSDFSYPARREDRGHDDRFSNSTPHLSNAEFDELADSVRENIATQRQNNLEIDQRQVGEKLEEYPTSPEQFWDQYSISVKAGRPMKPTKPIIPHLSFEATPFSDAIKEKMTRSFEHPSPIQSQSWPYCTEGQNLVCIAKTGSGKTLAFTLPALKHVVQSKEEAVHDPRNRRSGRRGPRHPVKAIFIAPTRELAQQIADQVRDYGRVEGVHSVCVFGGASKMGQASKIERGVDIVVGTPGRIADFLRMGVLDLSKADFCVLDEADRMLDMGFEPQINEIFAYMPEERQTVLYSATWPRGVQELADSYVENPIEVRIGNQSGSMEASKSVTQYVKVVQENQKFGLFLNLMQKLQAQAKTLVFVQTKIQCDRFARELNKMGVEAEPLHSDLSQMQRQQVLSMFREGDVQCVIATELASRGLDVKQIDCVVNYDFPQNVEDYVHRIGRTGRANKMGTAFTFFTLSDNGSKELVNIMEKADQDIPADLRKLVQLTGHKHSQSRYRPRGGQGGGRQMFSSRGRQRSDGNQRGNRW